MSNYIYQMKELFKTFEKILFVTL